MLKLRFVICALLTIYAAQTPKSTQIPFTAQRKPEITQSSVLIRLGLRI